jgi:pimeloyl-ACP methyl ester carboxylesterase
MKVRHVIFKGFGGLNLTADVRGDEDAWPVLFLHGKGQTRHAWDRTAQFVAGEGWQTITLDLRGHGDSDWAPDANYDIEAYRNDVIAVVEQIGRPPVLVGASLGGMSAMLAEGASDTVISSGLVLVDIAPKSNPEGARRIRDFMNSGIDGFPSLEEAAAAIAAYTPQRVRKTNLEGLKKVLRERDGHWFWHWDPKIQIGESQKEFVPRLYAFIDEAMDHVTVPTMLVRGGLSDLVTQEGVDTLFERLPNITLVEVDGAAHMIAGDKNDAFSDAVVNFLREQIMPTVTSRTEE